MRYPMPILFVGLLLGSVAPQGQAIPPSASQSSAQTDARQEKKEKKEKKVWTNEDLERLRLASPRPMVIGSAAATADTAAAHDASESAGQQQAAGAAAPALAQENDPAWYRQRASTLRAELDRIDSELARLRDFLREPSTGRTGIGLSGNNAALTPEDQINVLERRRQAVRQQLDDLEEQARRHSISPGVVR